MDGGKRYQIACVEENILVRFPANEIWELKTLITREFGLRQEHWEGCLSFIKLVWCGPAQVEISTRHLLRLRVCCLVLCPRVFCPIFRFSFLQKEQHFHEPKLEQSVYLSSELHTENREKFPFDIKAKIALCQKFSLFSKRSFILFSLRSFALWIYHEISLI